MLVYICILNLIFKLFIPTQDQNHPKFEEEKQSYIKLISNSRWLSTFSYFEAEKCLELKSTQNLGLNIKPP